MPGSFSGMDETSAEFAEAQVLQQFHIGKCLQAYKNC